MIKLLVSCDNFIALEEVIDFMHKSKKKKGDKFISMQNLQLTVTPLASKFLF